MLAVVSIMRSIVPLDRIPTDDVVFWSRSAALRAALAVAAARDMTLVVAAGNHRCDFASMGVRGCISQKGAIRGFPAGYSDVFPNIVAVAAVAPDGRPANFTNFDSSDNPKVHVLAPGDSILTCSNSGTQGKGDSQPDRAVFISQTAGIIPDIPAIKGRRLHGRCGFRLCQGEWHVLRHPNSGSSGSTGSL